MRIIPLVIKELKSFFFSPTAYVLMVIFLLLTGFFFGNTYFLAGEAELRNFVSVMPFLLMFFIPAVTMRLIAEEKKNGTHELLLTTPLSDAEFVIGKYLSAMIFFAIILAFTMYYPLVVLMTGSPDFGEMVATYVGILLLSSFYMAIGVFASSITHNQIVAFIVSFVIIFLFYITNQFAMLLPNALGGALNYLSASYHFRGFTMGLIDAKNVIYFLTMTALFLHGARMAVEQRKG